MSKKRPVMILEHKETKEVKRMVFKPGIRFLIRLGKMVKSWDLVEVEGDPEDPNVIFMKNQIERYKQDPDHFQISRGEVFSTASKVTGMNPEAIQKKVREFRDKYNLLERAKRHLGWRE